MKYNTVVLIAILITAVLALGLSYVISNYFFSQYSFYKMIQLFFAVLFLTTFYSPIKFFLIEYMDSEGPKDE